MKLATPGTDNRFMAFPFHHLSVQPRMAIRGCRQALAVAVIFLATPSIAGTTVKARNADGPVTTTPPIFDRMGDGAETSAPVIAVANETKREEPDIDLYVLMSGKCSTLRVAGRDFACRAVAYFHSQQGRASFAIALDDPADDSHIISFSGEKSRKEKDSLYELSIDRMLLNSKNRPKVDGLPVPSVEASTGKCRQLGNFATAQISSIACNAIAEDGKKYELQFESDGSPMTVRRITQSPPSLAKHRARQTEQIKCRNQADAAKVLPRDLTTYIIRCLAENRRKPANEGHP
jgi:hypothetical protein